MVRTILQTLTAIAQSYRDRSAPLTNFLLGVITAVFATELGIVVTTPIETTRVFATGLFGVNPLIAWLSAPFLHRGIIHFLTSVLFLLIVGLPVEPAWSRRRYVAFLLLSGYGATAVGGGILVYFSEQQVAFYGTSGILYALSGFALVQFLPLSEPRDSAELIALLSGVSALLMTVIDLLTGPYFTHQWVNGGHLGGFCIGVIAAVFRWNIEQSATEVK